MSPGPIGSFELHGLPEFRGAAGRLRAEIERAARAGVAAAGMAVEAQAKKNCPVDSNRLRGSIHTVVYLDQILAEVGTDEEYAAAVEMGWSKWGTHDGKRWWWAPVGKTASGRAWLEEHFGSFALSTHKGRGMFRESRQRRTAAALGVQAESFGAEPPLALLGGIWYLRVSGDPAKHPPHPFLLPALEAKRAAIPGIIARYMNRALTMSGGMA